jgi:exopolysaccharide biosynthesis polyprenyl glycosylphosphotransferase
MKNKILRFLQLRRYRISLVLIDAVVVWLVVSAAAFLSGASKASNLYHLVVIGTWVITATFFLLYSIWRYSIKKIIFAVFSSWIFLNVLTFYFGRAPEKREFLLWMLPLFFIFMLGERILLKTIRFYVTKEGQGEEKRAVVLGIGKEAEKISKEITGCEGLNYEITGFIDLGQDELAVEKSKILGGINNLYKIVKKENISEAIIAPSSYTESLDKEINKIIKDHSELDLSFKIASSLYDSLLGKLKVGRAPNLFLLDISSESDKKIYFIYKRLLDFFGSFFILLIFSPVLLLIALILKICEKGTVFYKQKRLGIDGKPFVLYKFRSMVPDAEKDTGPVWAEVKDSRVTPFGRFLRKTSLDEFPQFWNVLKGDMSLVGPRPERPHFVKKHKELQGRRMNVKPGVTGLAQVNGRYNLGVRHKVKYDYIYLKNCSFSLDLKILFETIWVVLTARGVK